jgi:peptidoglycan hydrolase-like amidase
MGRKLPALNAEPEIGVLLSHGPKVTFTLLQPGVAEGNSERVNLPAGEVTAQAVTGGIRILGHAHGNLGPDVVIRVRSRPGTAVFTVLMATAAGKAQRLTFSGQPEIHLDQASCKADLVERVGLETYLAGVIASEMNPNWPLEALKAQAVVARSYAADRFLKRCDQPWQLHSSFTVDMAYGGLKTLRSGPAAALTQTRGQMLTCQNLPVPALFHACSGGRTESARNFRPDLVGADGVTNMLAVMPSVDDPAAAAGAMALGFKASHLDWRCDLSLATVTGSLQTWARSHAQEGWSFGRVEAVSIAERYADSGRVANVTIRHFQGSREVDTVMPAEDFRLAIGPGAVRSTAWTRCTVASRHGGELVIEGRGYGHGVGMSQVSAYQMASDGGTAQSILAHFYPGATLEKKW